MMNIQFGKISKGDPGFLIVFIGFKETDLNILCSKIKIKVNNKINKIVIIKLI